MKSRLLAFGCLTLIVTGLASFPARSDSVGLSVNGTCEVGSCPPSPLPVGASADNSFSFNVTINGDLFNIAGFVSSFNNGPNDNGWNDVFTVELLSGQTAQADLLTVHALWVSQPRPGTTQPTPMRNSAPLAQACPRAVLLQLQ